MRRIEPEGDVPIYEQLAGILRDLITSGTIPPRRSIPSKRTLVQDYEVAPGTVEHALAVLKAEGRLKTVLGRGLFVTPPSEWRDG